MSNTNECPNCEVLRKKIAELEERLARLEEEMRASKRQTTPFSKGKQKKDPKILFLK